MYVPCEWSTIGSTYQGQMVSLASVRRDLLLLGCPKGLQTPSMECNKWTGGRERSEKAYIGTTQLGVLACISNSAESFCRPSYSS